MSRCPELSQVCRLIGDSLSPFTEKVVVSVTKEKERDLLVVLSQVVRGIQLITDELDCNTTSDTLVKPGCISSLDSHSEDHDCVTKIIADLVVLLAVESHFVQHLAGNILVVISEFIAASGSNWGIFIHLLCVSLELAMSNTLSCSLSPSTTESKESHLDFSSSIIYLKPRLKNANWFIVAGIIRALRNILKNLKQEDDDELIETCLYSVSSTLSNAPWNLLNDIYVDQNADARKISCEYGSHHINVWRPESRLAFLGNLVQLFCSLVEPSAMVEAISGSPDKHQSVIKLCNLVPEILYWCLGKQGESNNMCISLYFKHKLLMLMIRLSSQIQLKCSILVSWLQLLDKYFHDLLWQPMVQDVCSQDDCLEGSPFLVSVSDGEVHSMSSRHLQRQAVFLFLRCSFSISLREKSSEHCACAIQNSFRTFDLSADLECCSRKKGFTELYKWLQGHLPAQMFVDYEMYLENCISFDLSFLQLFMHEDDILFKVLLLLYSVPFCAEQHCSKDGGTFGEMKEDILFHVSNLFNPVNLFHLFLAELHYDHQVLLDYLISKDTGISCAEYLLRCLRTVCDSWHLFVEFSVCGNQSSCKKRKVLGCPNSQVELSHGQVKGDVVAVSLEESHQRDNNYGRKQYRTRGQPFTEAKECLLSLKSSVENLHQKKLFPYNPEVLLRRLKRFQELSLMQENYVLP